MIHQIYSVSELVQIVDGKMMSVAGNDLSVRDIIIDSRQFITAEKCMFVALVSNRNDGHNYLQQLYAKGLRVFMISHTNFFKRKYAWRCFLYW